MRYGFEDVQVFFRVVTAEGGRNDGTGLGQGCVNAREEDEITGACFLDVYCISVYQYLNSPRDVAARCTRRGSKETHLDSSSMIPSTVAKTISSSSSNEYPSPSTFTLSPTCSVPLITLPNARND